MSNNEVLDSLIFHLGNLLADLQEIKRKNAGASGAQTPSPKDSSVKSAPASTQKTQEIRKIFPEELEALLTFEQKGNNIIIKPKHFLGSENFAKISSVVRGIGGQYVSAGKESHWRVPT